MKNAIRIALIAVVIVLAFSGTVGARERNIVRSADTQVVVSGNLELRFEDSTGDVIEVLDGEPFSIYAVLAEATGAPIADAPYGAVQNFGNVTIIVISN
jgi:hypothetical protein